MGLSFRCSFTRRFLLPLRCSGRVKTLHPKVHGGILARRDLETHQKAIDAHNIDLIDIVVVNLYPFRETVLADKEPTYAVRMRSRGCSRVEPGAALLWWEWGDRRASCRFIGGCVHGEFLFVRPDRAFARF